MTETRRYWDEDAQSWEDSSDRGTTRTVTPPPPLPLPLRQGASAPGPSSRRAAARRSPGVRRPLGSRRFRGRGRRVLGVVLGTVSVLALIALAAFLQSSIDGESGRAASSSTPSPGDSDSPAAPDPETSDPTAPPAEAIPDGYRSVKDEEGFKIAVPKEWYRAGSHSDPSVGAFDVGYANDGGTAELHVFEVSKASSEQLFPDLTGRTDIHELSQPEDFEESLLSGQRREYQVGPDGAHVIDSRFEAIDGIVYGVAVYTRDGADYEDRPEEIAGVALRNFCPPEVACVG